MKGIFTLLLVTVSMIYASAQTVTPVQPVNEYLRFKETSFDFGKILHNRPVTHNFEVMNTSKEAIKIDNVQASCGCTTPEWTRDAIQPGASAFIKVGYNAASEGHFEKYITVTYNGSGSKQIKIKGEVWKAPVGAAPANASIQLLKQQTN